MDFGTIASYRSIDVDTVMNSDKLIQAPPVFTSPIATVAAVFWGRKASFLRPNVLSRHHQRTPVVCCEQAFLSRARAEQTENLTCLFVWFLSIIVLCQCGFFLLRQQLSILFRSERRYQNLQKSLRCRPQ